MDDIPKLLSEYKQLLSSWRSVASLTSSEGCHLTAALKLEIGSKFSEQRRMSSHLLTQTHIIGETRVLGLLKKLPRRCAGQPRDAKSIAGPTLPPLPCKVDQVLDIRSKRTQINYYFLYYDVDFQLNFKLNFSNAFIMNEKPYHCYLLLLFFVHFCVHNQSRRAWSWGRTFSTEI